MLWFTCLVNHLIDKWTMEIYYTSKRMQAMCTAERQMVKTLGRPMANRLMQRLTELEAAETLEDMRRLPGARCHELKGERAGQLAVDLVHPRRLVFRPQHDPIPVKPDGGMDWTRVSTIIVLEIVDYHG